MLRVSSLRKSIGDRILFDNLSFTLQAPEKVGLIGPNGSGKSTLLALLAGTAEADFGTIKLSPSTSICLLPQHVDADHGVTVEGWLQPRLSRLEARLRSLEGRLDDPPSLALYGELLDAFARGGGWDRAARTEGVLRRVDLRVDAGRPVSTLSGGEKTRLALARVLLSLEDRSLLLLDEPTNHLDAEGVERLEAELRATSSAGIVVSHDRRLLDAVTSRTLAIDPRSGQVREYAGGYSESRRQRGVEEEKAWRAHAEQQERVRRLTADIGAMRAQARSYEGRSVNDFQRGKAKRLAAKAKARETRLMRELDDARRCDKPRLAEETRARFEGSPLHHALLLSLEAVSVGCLRDVSVTLRGSVRVALSGRNGSGKTTLIRAAVGLVAPSAGVVWRRETLRVGYLPQQQETLDPRRTVLESFTHGRSVHAGEARTFLHRFLFKGDDVFKTVAVLSRGERTRLLLARLMALDPQLLILDEPTNHLDLDGMESLERALDGFRGALLFSTHDRAFAARMRPDETWVVGDGRVVPVR